MRRINLEHDIKPLSEFRANTAKFIQQIKKTKRPLILTQHGKSAAVLLDVSVYQAIMEKLELLEEIRTGEKQILEGQYITHEQVKERLSERYNK